MKVNDKELADLSSGPAVIEGRLHYKRSGGNISQGYKERWFKLKYNVLFYFNLSETGTVIDTKPAGAIVLVNCSAHMELMEETPFTFSLQFKDEIDKKHLFSGRTEDNVTLWVNALNASSYESWRKRLKELQSKLNGLTGQDPLQMLNRSENFNLDLAEEEKSSTQTNRSKRVKKKSFRSYVDSDIDPAAPDLKEIGLSFNFNHFRNGLEAIGSSAGPRTEKAKIEPVAPTASLENLTLNKAKASQETSVIARPRPTRRAPDPPVRPPRGQKAGSTEPAPSKNLIDF